MPQAFNVIEHIIPGQHIRGYPHATRFRQEDSLQLALKQYVPRDSLDPLPEDAVTIIGAHGNGFPKETYEPLWDDLYAQLQSRGVHIRAIWMADCSNQGASGVVNEEVQGDSTNWFDHSRDLLLMINHFRDEMPRPLIGIAHSMGCAQLVQLSIMHPRLLSTLILYEPVILSSGVAGPNPALMSTQRRDLWPTRSAATNALGRAFGNWDTRCTALYLNYGLRGMPTPLYDPARSNTTAVAATPPEAVTLTTSKHQEAWAFAQPNWEDPAATAANGGSSPEGLLFADWDKQIERPFLWSRPECLVTMHNLPHVRPSVLYVFGGKSPLSPLEAQDEKVKVTGAGLGGSKGATVTEDAPTVEKVVLEKAGHLCVFEREALVQCVEAGAKWIRRWYFQGWKREEAFWRTYRSKKSEGREMWKVSEEWKKAVRLPTDTPRWTAQREKKL